MVYFIFIIEKLEEVKALNNQLGNDSGIVRKNNKISRPEIFDPSKQYFPVALAPIAM